MKSCSWNNKLIKQSCYNRFLLSSFFHLSTRIPLGNSYYRFDDFPYIIVTDYFSHEHELRISQILQFFWPQLFKPIQEISQRCTLQWKNASRMCMHPQPLYFLKFYNSTESALMQVTSFDIKLELRDYSHRIRTNKEMLTEIRTPFNSYQGRFSAMNFHWYLMTSNYFVQMNFMRKIIFPKSISADCIGPYMSKLAFPYPPFGPNQRSFNRMNHTQLS